jgi:hypothetical protein
MQVSDLYESGLSLSPLALANDFLVLALSVFKGAANVFGTYNEKAQTHLRCKVSAEIP